MTGDADRLGLLGAEAGVDEIPDLYLDVASLVRGFPEAGKALFFSDGTNGRLR